MRWARRVSLLALGGATGVLQALVIREALALTSGDESVVAILLGIWLLETGLGSLANRHWTAPPAITRWGFVGYALLIVATVLAARASALLLPVGEVAGLITVGLGASAILAPACLLSGFLFGQISRAHDDQPEGNSSATAYLLDTLGGGLAGVLLAVLALDFLLPIQIAALGCAMAIAAFAYQSKHRLAPLAIGLAACVGLFVLPIDRAAYRWHAPDQKVIDIRSSPNGTLLVTEREGQRQIIQHRRPILVPSDLESSEQIAHLVAAIHPAPRRALLIGMPPGNYAKSVLAHGCESLAIVVGDPNSASIVRDVAPHVSDSRVRVIGEDPRAWVRSSSTQRLDLVFVLVGTPSSVTQARLYSKSFYQDIANVVANEGILAIAMPGFSAYASDTERDLHRTVTSTLRTAFEHVVSLPADHTLVLASNGKLPEPSVAASLIQSRMAERGIDAEYVNGGWLSNRLSPERIEQAQRWSSGVQEPSTDAHPVVYRMALRAVAEQLGGGGTDVLVVLAASLLVIVATWVNPKSRPVSFALATSGFAGLSIQLVLMIAYQTAVGALYRDVALVTGVYMLASCLGTLLGMRLSANRTALLIVDVIQVLVAVVVAVLVGAVMDLDSVPARVWVSVGALLIGAVLGVQFSLVSRIGTFRNGVGAMAYGTELIGASLSALVTITLVVPWLGVAGAAWVVVAVKLISSSGLAFGSRDATESGPWYLPIPTWMFVGLLLTAVWSVTEIRLSQATMSGWYHLLVVAILAVVVLAEFQPRSLRTAVESLERKFKIVRDRCGVSPLQALVFIALLPLAVVPLGRCYFVIPYVMCHACPRVCVFGVLRPYIIVSALVSNVGNMRFCGRTCPLGISQEAAGMSARSSTSRGIWRVGKVAWVVRIAVLLSVVWLYYIGLGWNERDGTGVIDWLYGSRYLIGAVTAGLVLVLSYYVRRPFCAAVCPIGTVGEALVAADRLVRKRRTDYGQEPE